MLNKMLLTCVAGVMTGVIPAVVSADYVVNTTSAGAQSVSVFPGQSVDIDVVLASDGSDTHTSAIVRVEFSAAGLTLAGIDWSAPYVDDSIFNDTVPSADDLPAAMTAGMLAGLGYPQGVVDMQLSNVVPVGAFSVGILATLSIDIPADFDASVIQIRAVPDTIANGFVEINAATGNTFELRVIPTPGATALLALGLGMVARRRRSE